MKNLVMNGQTITSREIAELTGKRHDHLMRDIRLMEESWINIGQPKFGETSYTDQWNRNQPQFNLSKTECIYIATKFNDEARAKLVIRWQELELKNQFDITNPNNILQIVQNWITDKNEKDRLQIENNEKQKQIEEYRPKAIFADAVNSSTTTILIGELAKIMRQNGIDIGQNRFFDWLRDHEYLIKRFGEDHNMPTQKSMDLELFEIKETVVHKSNGLSSIYKTTKVTGKGQTYFVNKFLSQTA